jgi:hypothetical protein
LKFLSASAGVLHSVLGLMEIAARETFIIDPRGRIAKHYASVDPKGQNSKTHWPLTARKYSYPARERQSAHPTSPPADVSAHADQPHPRSTQKMPANSEYSVSHAPQ